MKSSLPNAVRAAIAHGNSIHDISLPRWSETYGNCGVEYIRIVWEGIASEASLKPSNSYEEGYGK